MNTAFETPLLYQGGPIMLLIALLAITGLFCFLERFFYLHRRRTNCARFVQGIQNLMQKDRFLEALTMCEEAPGPIPALTKIALLNHDQPEAKMRTAIEQMGSVFVADLERRIGIIGLIAKAAPLLGLLGTLIALLETFSTMGQLGAYAEFTQFSNHIAEALLTSIFGLVVSACAWMGFYLLNERVRVFVRDMDWTGTTLLNHFAKGHAPRQQISPE